MEYSIFKNRPGDNVVLPDPPVTRFDSQLPGSFICPILNNGKMIFPHEYPASGDILFKDS